MKKLLSLLALALVCVLAMTMGASAQVNADVKVSAIAEVYTYHQIKAFVLEYPTEVAEPEEGTYTIVDFAPAHMKEDYDQRPYAEAVITAVYTNDAPEMREDKTSVPGKYVIIEQELVNGSFYDEKDEVWKPNNLCGLGTWRNLGEGCEWLRDDFTELIISQQKNVKDAEGNIVAKPALMPTLQKADLHTKLLDDFIITKTPAPNGKYDIYYSLGLPANYDASKKYPVVLTCHGIGGSINYDQVDAEGNYVCQGGDLGRDAVPVSWLREVKEDVIVLSIQRWRNAPAEWEVNAEEDAVYLVNELAKEYSFDMERIYGIGSSAGTMHLSQLINLHPDFLAGYIQCNGMWTIDPNGKTPEERAVNIYKSEYQTNGKTVQTTVTQALSLQEREDCFKSEEEIAALKAMMQPVADARLPIYIWHNPNDASISWTFAISAYDVLRDLYHDAGLSEAEINNLIKLYFADDAEYHDFGICEMHATSKLTVWYPWAMEWLLAQ